MDFESEIHMKCLQRADKNDISRKARSTDLYAALRQVDLHADQDPSQLQHSCQLILQRMLNHNSIMTTDMVIIIAEL